MSEFLARLEQADQHAPSIATALRGPDIPLFGLKFLLTARIRHLVQMEYGLTRPKLILILGSDRIAEAKAEWGVLAKHILKAHSTEPLDFLTTKWYFATQIKSALNHWAHHCRIALDDLLGLGYLEYNEYIFMRELSITISDFACVSSEYNSNRVLEAMESFRPKEKEE